MPDTQLALNTFRRRRIRESGRRRRNSFGTLSGPVAFPTDSACKADESYWGVVAVPIVWPCEEGGNIAEGTGSGEPRTVYVGSKALGFLDIIDKEDAVTS